MAKVTYFSNKTDGSRGQENMVEVTLHHQVEQWVQSQVKNEIKQFENIAFVKT